ncbi:MAG: hypothetical protein VX642_10490 [Bdellovibrionota bacterium]|nr:hypothetical protein [Bdellovibrionota bacterium]
MNLLKLVIVSLMIPIKIFAGQEAGNGGVGVLANNGAKVYLLDFAENGIEESAFFQDRETYDQDILESIELSLDPEVFPTKLIAAKLSELRRHSSTNSYILTRIISKLKWRVVNFDLLKTNDEKSKIVLGENRVQLASRVRLTVRINSKYLDKLDPDNFTGLVLHEARYIAEKLQYKIEVSDGLRVKCAEEKHYYSDCLERTGRRMYYQSVQRVKDYIGDLFSPGYENFLNPLLGQLESRINFHWELESLLLELVLQLDHGKDYTHLYALYQTYPTLYYLNTTKNTFYQWKDDFSTPVSDEEMYELFCSSLDFQNTLQQFKYVYFKIGLEVENGDGLFSITVPDLYELKSSTRHIEMTSQNCLEKLKEAFRPISQN